MELTDEERRAAAMACRAAAYRASEDAKAQTNPTVRAGFEATERRYRALAEKLEPAPSYSPSAL